MKENETVDEFAGKLSTISSKFSILGDTLEDSTLVKKLLDSVPDKYFPVVAGIEQFYDLDTMAFEEAVGRLKAFEERAVRLRNNASNTDGQLLLTQAEWQARQRGTITDTSSGGRGRGFRNPDHGRGHGRWRGRGHSGYSAPRQENTGGSTSGAVNGTRDKSHIKCFKCERMGHYASECHGKRHDDEAHLTRTVDEEPALLLTMSQGGCALGRGVAGMLHCSTKKDHRRDRHHDTKKEENEDLWYLDNGASNHMTGHRAKFQELNEAVTGRVKLGDGSTVQIMDKGTVMFACKNGDQKALHEVYYIPKLCNNIISLGQMTEDGNEVLMAGDTAKVFDKSGKLLMSVKRTQHRRQKHQVCLHHH
ncbi:uncharacterized protein LOC120264988 [Dioscorea cayenensis subsp. rotundata]|uniref:Uncharacterized protein LOC120264988 n=1 Tax=Dioscorea cayennensis subsp. rotundata TaxID=55577 RepID=A0AB40BN89_DIOCR|nr:uncharacterized protein LOC120264988 [Dioscorea cayenensis subsp. rotundata]